MKRLIFAAALAPAACMATACATTTARFNEVRFTLVSACQGIVLEPEANEDVVNACKEILALNEVLPT